MPDRLKSLIWPLKENTFLSSVPPSNSVSKPWKTFWAGECAFHPWPSTSTRMLLLELQKCNDTIRWGKLSTESLGYQSRATDAHLDCAFVKTTLVYFIPKIWRRLFAPLFRPPARNKPFDGGPTRLIAGAQPPPIRSSSQPPPQRPQRMSPISPSSPNTLGSPRGISPSSSHQLQVNRNNYLNQPMATASTAVFRSYLWNSINNTQSAHISIFVAQFFHSLLLTKICVQSTGTVSGHCICDGLFGSINLV